MRIRSALLPAAGLLALVVLVTASWPVGAQRSGASLQGIQDQIDVMTQRLVPIGAVLPFSGSLAAVPAEFLICDGTELDRSVHADLFAVIGTAHGDGDGSTTFRLPDYRGRFARGVDAGAGRDFGTRSAMNPGGNVDDAVGSVEDGDTAGPINAFSMTTDGTHGHTSSNAGSHPHWTALRRRIFDGSTNCCPANICGPLCNCPCFDEGDRDGSERWTTSMNHITSSAGNHQHFGTDQSPSDHAHALTGGDAETRPVNAAVHWIIKH